jgi:hypothetical protein
MGLEIKEEMDMVDGIRAYLGAYPLLSRMG